jgi:phosphoribosylformylglycinamidine synthase
MAFAGRTGIDVDITDLGADPIRALFAEELGAVVQVAVADRGRFEQAMADAGLNSCVHRLGQLRSDQRIRVRSGSASLIDEGVLSLFADWIDTSHRIQSLRDNPSCADQEREWLLSENNRGLSASLTFDSSESREFTERPRVAILREQGVNGQVEMAAAFDRAGFDAIDVHMNDLRSGTVSLADFTGLVACGGFSYGDVLGAGGGWAKSILFNDELRSEFMGFFHREDTFSLGVCNGCQMLSQLKSLIPGAAHWPRFVRNDSAQFEARLTQVEVLDSPSILMRGMSGSIIPIPVAHGEGRVAFDDPSDAESSRVLAALRYVDSAREPTVHYPENPNGSADGFTAFTTTDGRSTIMMPHPERAFRSVQFSWGPDEWGEDGPWMRLFRNAREWVG